MLSERERRTLEEIEQSFDDDDGQEPPLPPGSSRRAGRARGHPGARLLARTGAGISVSLLVVGVPVAACALAAATALVWLLVRYWEPLSDKGSAPSPARDLELCRRRERRRRRRRELAEYLQRMAEGK